MADADPLPAALAEIRERNEERIRAMRYTEYTVEHHAAEGDVRRLLAGYDAFLALHQPRTSFGVTVCGHCTDTGGGTLLVTFPCKTYTDILGALMKGKNGG